MPRPWRQRYVHINPEISRFRPHGRKTSDLEVVFIFPEEVEAIRLVDFADWEQKRAARHMKVPTTTFQRTLYAARRKVAEALIYGKVIEIKKREEVINMPGGDGTGPMGTGPVAGRGRGLGAGQGVGRGRGRGRQPNGFGMGPGGECVCPSCNTKAVHTRGIPCYQMDCPKCGTKMVRANN